MSNQNLNDAFAVYQESCQALDSFKTELDSVLTSYKMLEAARLEARRMLVATAENYFKDNPQARQLFDEKLSYLEESELTLVDANAAIQAIFAYCQNYSKETNVELFSTFLKPVLTGLTRRIKQNPHAFGMDVETYVTPFGEPAFRWKGSGMVLEKRLKVRLAKDIRESVE